MDIQPNSAIAGEKLGREMLARFNPYNSIPVDFTDLRGSLGIRTIYRFLPPSLSGALIKNSNGIYLVLNEADSYNRQAFNQACLLGIYLRNQDQIKIEAALPRDILTSYKKDLDLAFGVRFACAFLMPDVLFMQKLIVMDDLGIGINRAMAGLSALFGVPVEVVKLKIEFSRI